MMKKNIISIVDDDDTIIVSIFKKDPNNGIEGKKLKLIIKNKFNVILQAETYYELNTNIVYTVFTIPQAWKPIDIPDNELIIFVEKAI